LNLDWTGKLRKIKRTLDLSMIRHDLYPTRRLHSRYAKELKNWESHGKPLPLPILLKQRVVLDHGRHHGLRILVETGTYFGAMVEACKDAFVQIYSVELQEAFYHRAKKRFARFPNVRLFHGDSAAVLPTILSEITERCLFWLDAHYMGGITAKGASGCPALQELELIASHPVKGHVVLLDDARFFQGKGDWPTLGAVNELAAQHAWHCEVRDDIIRLLPRS
jgi:hypothetical protein